MARRASNLVKQALVGIRAEAGNGFLAALDDIRQKVVEEGWTGRTASTAHDIKVELKDPIAALYGAREAAAEPVAPTVTSLNPAELEQTTRAYNQAYSAGASRTVHEIEGSVPGDTLAWLRGPGAARGDALAIDLGRPAEPGRDPLGRSAKVEASQAELGRDLMGRTVAAAPPPPPMQHEPEELQQDTLEL